MNLRDLTDRLSRRISLGFFELNPSRPPRNHYSAPWLCSVRAH